MNADDTWKSDESHADFLCLICFGVLGGLLCKYGTAE